MWEIRKDGPNISVIDDNLDTVAVVGDEKDPRLVRKLQNARMISLAPEMVDLLIDVKTLIKYECLCEEHPLSQLLKKRVDALLDKCFRKGQEDVTKHASKPRGFLGQKFKN